MFVCKFTSHGRTCYKFIAISELMHGKFCRSHAVFPIVMHQVSNSFLVCGAEFIQKWSSLGDGCSCKNWTTSLCVSVNSDCLAKEICSSVPSKSMILKDLS